MSYVDCFVAPVPKAGREDYLKFSQAASAVFREHGALKLMDFWGDDVPSGERTSFPLAVQLAEGETVVASWIMWPSKAARDAGNEKVMADPRMQALAMPFDGKRAILGGFQTILES